MNDKTLARYTKELKLTPKQRKFLKVYFETGNGTKAALEAYDTDDYFIAASIAQQNLQKLKVPIKTFLEAKGLSIGHLVKVLVDGLKDNDANVRHKYLKTAAKWMEVETPTQEGGNVARRMTIEEFFE